ncbi:MAG: chromosome partitioning protein [Flavobacteriales bacterium]|jgi:ATP-binding protein involved in chromosome partitioning|nr:chromosome partitioning protein [Flavobacteriales bacterium]|tara:strand:- start:4671 stop:5732 length:1062 start_codon:yes stop_codon:yes gene_type:complete
MLITEDKLRKVLGSIDLEGSYNLVHSSILRELKIDDENVFLQLSISNPSLQFKNKLKTQIKEIISKEFPKVILEIEFIIEKTIKNIIAVASGKGGVGKSTISSNLAVALKNQGFKVGVVDADIYGPSIPLMFDAENEKPKQIEKDGKYFMSPIESYGVKIMSIGFFARPGDAMIWRGPMATKALKEIINNTAWGDLDYLLIDLPPGTGDIHLSIVQTLSITGSIIITTPQPVSVIDARKAINMFKNDTINIPIIGIVENMSWLLIDNKKHYIFGKDGGRNLSKAENVELLIEIPLNQSIREAGDIGRPAAMQQSNLTNVFNELAQLVNDSISKRNNNLPPTKKVEITHNRGCN